MMHAADREEPESVDAVDEGVRRAAEGQACADDDGEHDVCPVARSL